ADATAPATFTGTLTRRRGRQACRPPMPGSSGARSAARAGRFEREDSMTRIAVPRVIERLLSLPGLSFVARLCLASAFIQSGVAKLIDFQGAIAEIQHFGLRPAALFAATVILTQLGGSVLFLTRRYCWLGAGIL